MNVLAFTGALWLTWTGVAVVTVLLMGQFDPGYGRPNTFYMALLAGFVASLIAMAAFAASARIFRRSASPPRALLAGAACALAVLLLAEAVVVLTDNTGVPLFVSVCLVVLCGAAAALALPRAAASGSVIQQSARSV